MTPATRPAIAELGKPGTITGLGIDALRRTLGGGVEQRPRLPVGQLRVERGLGGGQDREIDGARGSQTLGDRSRPPRAPARPRASRRRRPRRGGARSRGRRARSRPRTALRAAGAARARCGAEVARSPVGSHDDEVGASCLRERGEPTLGRRGGHHPRGRPGALPPTPAQSASSSDGAASRREGSRRGTAPGQRPLGRDHAGEQQRRAVRRQLLRQPQRDIGGRRPVMADDDRAEHGARDAGDAWSGGRRGPAWRARPAPAGSGSRARFA